MRSRLERLYVLHRCQVQAVVMKHHLINGLMLVDLSIWVAGGKRICSFLTHVIMLIDCVRSNNYQRYSCNFPVDYLESVAFQWQR